jgi:hypothetical protein
MWLISFIKMSSQITGPFECEICNVTFNSREDLDRHNREKA